MCTTSLPELFKPSRISKNLWKNNFLEKNISKHPKKVNDYFHLSVSCIALWIQSTLRIAHTLRLLTTLRVLSTLTMLNTRTILKTPVIPVVVLCIEVQVKTLFFEHLPPNILVWVKDLVTIPCKFEFYRKDCMCWQVERSGNPDYDAKNEI